MGNSNEWIWQHIWDEVGESDNERDKMLLQLEQECLDVYRRKVEQASLSRANLHQAIADAETEIAHLTSTLGDRPLVKVSYMFPWSIKTFSEYDSYLVE